MKNKCKHKYFTYFPHQYGKNQNIYVLRKCKCGYLEKGKIGKFKPCSLNERIGWRI